MDRRQVYGGPRPPFSSLSVVHVLQVHVRVAGEGSPLFPSPVCSRRWCAHRRDPTAVLAFN